MTKLYSIGNFEIKIPSSKPVTDNYREALCLICDDRNWSEHFALCKTQEEAIRAFSKRFFGDMEKRSINCHMKHIIDELDSSHIKFQVYTREANSDGILWMPSSLTNCMKYEFDLESLKEA